MKSILSVVFVGALFMIGSAHAKEPDIPAASPAGSCCRIDGVEGASEWNANFGAWSCHLGALVKPGVQKQCAAPPAGLAAWWTLDDAAATGWASDLMRNVWPSG